jgi:hypothetical protein
VREPRMDENSRRFDELDGWKHGWTRGGNRNCHLLTLSSRSLQYRTRNSSRVSASVNPPPCPPSPTSLRLLADKCMGDKAASIECVTTSESSICVEASRPICVKASRRSKGVDSRWTAGESSTVPCFAFVGEFLLLPPSTERCRWVAESLAAAVAAVASAAPNTTSSASEELADPPTK